MFIIYKNLKSDYGCLMKTIDRTFYNYFLSVLKRRHKIIKFIAMKIQGYS